MIVYRAINKVNGKVYIGITTLTMEHRKQGHFRDTKRLNRPTVYFHNAILKYGKENFLFETIDEAKNIEELNKKEKEWIKFYNSTDKNKGYNLDSGGEYYKKSASTKNKIGKLKKKDWENKDLANKMMLGLRKATLKWQEVSQNNKVEFICPVCKKKILLAPWAFKKKKYCSHKCASKNNISYLKALKKREEIINKRNFQIQETINEWAKNNKELVINCPYNQIETCLAPLFNLVYENFNVKDKRTFTIAYCNTNSRKQFLKELKTFCENIC